MIQPEPGMTIVFSSVCAGVGSCSRAGRLYLFKDAGCHRMGLKALNATGTSRRHLLFGTAFCHSIGQS